jgi:hypothetical protein
MSKKYTMIELILRTILLNWRAGTFDSNDTVGPLRGELKDLVPKTGVLSKAKHFNDRVRVYEYHPGGVEGGRRQTSSGPIACRCDLAGCRSSTDC